MEVALDPESKKLTVISPIVGSPAYKAGILAGDVITKIDGVATADMKFPELAQRLRGKPGTSRAVNRPAGRAERADRAAADSPRIDPSRFRAGGLARRR